MRLRLIYPLLLFLALMPFKALATHIIGGELTYECLGNGVYEITLNIYRDCQPFQDQDGSWITPLGFDNVLGQPDVTLGAPDALINIYDANNEWVATEYFSSLEITQIEEPESNDCLSIPPEICIEQGTYKLTTTLPPIVGGYQIAYQRCCRNPSVINIQNPGQTGITVFTNIPNPATANCNSSPVFQFYPPLAICLSEVLEIDQSATDPDGDQLVYSFVTPYLGASVTSSDETTPPPFEEVAWVAPFEANNPLPATPSLAIDPNTGIITGQPTSQGLFIVGIMVEEYRNGIKINEIIRDFRFLVVECDQGYADFDVEDLICEGLTVEPIDQSTLANTYSWDFGDPTTTLDVSTLPNPSYTYPEGGTYEITLTINEGTVCEDVITKTVNIYPDLFPEIAAVDFQCFVGNSYNFEYRGDREQGIVYEWDFGPNATPQFSTAQNPEGIQFNEGGFHEISVTVSLNQCLNTATQLVEVGYKELLDISANPIGCDPHITNFKPITRNGRYSYSWFFGNGQSSTEEKPSILFSTGTYDISLEIVNLETGCVERIDVEDWIEVYDPPIAGMEVSPKEIFLGERVYVDDLSEKSNVYSIDFGNGHIIDEAEPSYEYPTAGDYVITQTVSNESGCIDTLSQKVSVLYDYTAYIPNVFSPNGDNLNDEFIPIYKGITDYKITIYNRWGELVFQRDIGDGIHWNGMYDGEKASQDVYIYIANLQTDTGKIIERKGHVTLVR